MLVAQSFSSFFAKFLSYLMIFPSFSVSAHSNLKNHQILAKILQKMKKSPHFSMDDSKRPPDPSLLLIKYFYIQKQFFRNFILVLSTIGSGISWAMKHSTTLNVNYTWINICQSLLFYWFLCLFVSSATYSIVIADTDDANFVPESLCRLEKEFLRAWIKPLSWPKMLAIRQ